MKKKFLVLSGSILGLAPTIVLAQVNYSKLPPSPKFQDLILYVAYIINTAVIPLFFTLALAMFIWGVIQFVIKSDEEAKKEKGKEFMLWGIIALAVMVGVWGLVGILTNTFNLSDRNYIPQVKSP